VGVGIYAATRSEAIASLTTGALIAPVVEESLKGFAVLVVFLVFRDEFDTLLDGIVYAAITALGFAATENVYYIYNYGYLENGLSGLVALVFVRVVLVGWQHAFYSAFIGIGLAITRLTRHRWLKFAAPLAGWSFAVLAHATHNTLAATLGGREGFLIGTLVDWAGWFLMLLVILAAIASERRAIRHHLRDEMESGLITPTQYRTARNAFAQSIASLTGLFSGRYATTKRFYQLCAELAQKKQQRSLLGEEQEIAKIIADLRAEIQRLSPLAAS